MRRQTYNRGFGFRGPFNAPYLPLRRDEFSEADTNQFYIPGDPLYVEEGSENPLHSHAEPPRLRPSDYLRRSNAGQQISTGITPLDGVIGGGLFPGYVHVIVGPPRSFKTSLATQIGLDLFQRGHRVVMLLADESPESLIERFYYLAGSRTPRAELLLDPRHPDHLLLEDPNLTILSATDTLEAALEEISSKRDGSLPAVLIIDSIQKVAQNLHGLGDLREGVIRALNTTAAAVKSEKVIGLVLSKASRASYITSRPDVVVMASGAETSYLESDADVLLCLRPGKLPDTSELLVEKHRKAERGGIVRFQLDRSAQCLRALTAEETISQEDALLERRVSAKRKARARRQKEKDEGKALQERTDCQVVLDALRNRHEASQATLKALTRLSHARLRCALETAQKRGQASSRVAKEEKGAHLWKAISPPGPVARAADELLAGAEKIVLDVEGGGGLRDGTSMILVGSPS